MDPWAPLLPRTLREEQRDSPGLCVACLTKSLPTYHMPGPQPEANLALLSIVALVLTTVHAFLVPDSTSAGPPS